MIRKIIIPVWLVLLVVVLSGWGAAGHLRISGSSADAYPPQIAFLKPSWSNYVTEHSSDADYRKSTDPDESPRHYIDIDNYSGFTFYGKIPMTWDSVVALYGYSFVVGEGILPWATVRAYDSLKSCFTRKDWSSASRWAADLGHYVGDGHMPLHITRNYNGQYTGQTGVHTRYESRLIGRYEEELSYDPGTAVYIPDIPGFVFTYIYKNYQYVDSILQADLYAYNLTGSHSSDAYYQAFWQKTGDFTGDLFRNASWSLASLIYTAWVEAGSPTMDPNGMEDQNPGNISLFSCYPDPFTTATVIPFELKDGGEVTAELVYSGGFAAETIARGYYPAGRHEITFSAPSLPAGVYLVRIRTPRGASVTRVIKINH